MANAPATSLPDLPEIHRVRPVGPEDEACFQEVRSVLERHNALQRFGLTLLHKHFDLDEEEVLLESVDVDNRTLTQMPFNRDRDNGGTSIETAWRLDDPRGQRRCEIVCQPDRDRDGNPIHSRNHYQTS